MQIADNYAQIENLMHTATLFFQQIISITKNSLQEYAWIWDCEDNVCKITIPSQNAFYYVIDYQRNTEKNVTINIQFPQNISQNNEFLYYGEQIKAQKLQKRYTISQEKQQITNQANISKLMLENMTEIDLAAYLQAILQQVHTDFFVEG
jgi:hypothetical protein